MKTRYAKYYRLTITSKEAPWRKYALYLSSKGKIEKEYLPQNTLNPVSDCELERITKKELKEVIKGSL